MANIDFDLYPKQEMAFMSRATEILFGGAAGPGKSHLMRVAFIIWALEISCLQLYLFRRTYPDLIQSHMDGPTGFPMMLADLVDLGYCKINYSDNKIVFYNKSMIHLCHCQYEKDVFGYQSAEMHGLGIDELTQFSDTMYRFLRSRVRMTGLKIPDKYQGYFPRIFCSSNPGGLGHNWVKKTFIDNCQPLDIRRVGKKEGGMLRQYIPARLEDNPSLLEDSPDYVDKLEGLGSESLVKAMKYGDWDIVAGGMFDDVWNRDVHVIEPFSIPSSWRIYCVFDWGSSKPFSVGWFIVTDGTTHNGIPNFARGTIIRFAEWYGCEKDDNGNSMPNVGINMLPGKVAKGILEREEEMGISKYSLIRKADPSIFNASIGISVASEMAKYKMYFEPANASTGTRKIRWQLLRKMLLASCADYREEPGFFVFSHCLDFIRTVPVAPRDPKNPDDVDTKSEDHILDETGYMIMETESHSGRVNISY